MILSDKKIIDLLNKKELIIEPLDEGQIQPASVDLKLGSHFLKIDENKVPLIDLEAEIVYEEFHANEVIIPPKSFLLASTREYIKIPNNLTAFVEGRSSIGRIGLSIQNAGWVDPGFEGTITLQLFNSNQIPIKLTSGRRLCQLVFAEMDQEALNPYNGKYQGQRKALGSRVYVDFDKLKNNS